jgi:hypothetical protein
VIVLLAGQLRDPVPLLKMLSQKEATSTNPHGDDLFRHRLALAAQCLPEAEPALLRLQKMEWADEITAETFNTLWGHRKNRTDKAVSHLTVALLTLMQVNAEVRPGTPLLTEMLQRQTEDYASIFDDAEVLAAFRERVSTLDKILAALCSVPAWPMKTGRSATLPPKRSVMSWHGGSGFFSKNREGGN